MPRDKSEVESSLLKKGFKPTHPGSDHNWFVYVASDGKKAIGARTKTSHGRGFDLDDFLLGQMARQVSLTKKQFLELVDCPLSREEYEKILKTAGKL
jgi:hypothetical protein